MNWAQSEETSHVIGSAPEASHKRILHVIRELADILLSTSVTQTSTSGSGLTSRMRSDQDIVSLTLPKASVATQTDITRSQIRRLCRKEHTYLQSRRYPALASEESRPRQFSTPTLSNLGTASPMTREGYSPGYSTASPAPIEGADGTLDIRAALSMTSENEGQHSRGDAYQDMSNTKRASDVAGIDDRQEEADIFAAQVTSRAEEVGADYGAVLFMEKERGADDGAVLVMDKERGADDGAVSTMDKVRGADDGAVLATARGVLTAKEGSADDGAFFALYEVGADEPTTWIDARDKKSVSVTVQSHVVTEDGNCQDTDLECADDGAVSNVMLLAGESGNDRAEDGDDAPTGCAGTGSAICIVEEARAKDSVVDLADGESDWYEEAEFIDAEPNHDMSNAQGELVHRNSRKLGRQRFLRTQATATATDAKKTKKERIELPVKIVRREKIARKAARKNTAEQKEVEDEWWHNLAASYDPPVIKTPRQETSFQDAAKAAVFFTLRKDKIARREWESRQRIAKEERVYFVKKTQRLEAVLHRVQADDKRKQCKQRKKEKSQAKKAQKATATTTATTPTKEEEEPTKRDAPTGMTAEEEYWFKTIGKIPRPKVWPEIARLDPDGWPCPAFKLDVDDMNDWEEWLVRTNRLKRK